MMYWKLAIQNIRRSLRDYIIYFVTLTLTAALMYSFWHWAFRQMFLLWQRICRC